MIAELEPVPEAEPGSAPTTECRAEQRSALAERSSALPATEDRKLKTDNYLSEPGRLVFVYRKTPPAQEEKIHHRLPLS